MLALLGTHADVSFDLTQNRLLIEVEADHVRNERIDRFVVGNAVARSIGECDISGGIRPDQTRNAEGAVLTEDGRVEEIVVNTSIDHVHSLRASGGLHVHAFIVNEKVASLYEIAPHLAGEEAVLEVRRVVRPRCQHDHPALTRLSWGDAHQRVAKPSRVAFDGANMTPPKHSGKDALHHSPVLQHVAHTRWGSEVIFQDEEVAIGPANEVNSGDIHEDAFARQDPAERLEVAGRSKHHRRRDSPFVDDPLLMVEVGQEHVERRHTLNQPPLNPFPGSTRDYAWYQVKREDFFLPARIGVDRKRHPASKQRALREPLPGHELQSAELVQL